jgi:ABC-type uncharacterized transport system permease subunit
MLQALMIVVGCLADAFWGLIPAVLRTRWHVNEIITTLMCNYIAILWVDFLVYGPWKDPRGFGFPFAPPLPQTARLPSIPGSRVHLGLLLGLLAAAELAVLLKYTRLGYEIRIIGLSPGAARYAGMNLTRTTSPPGDWRHPADLCADDDTVCLHYSRLDHRQHQESPGAFQHPSRIGDGLHPRRVMAT